MLGIHRHARSKPASQHPYLHRTPQDWRRVWAHSTKAQPVSSAALEEALKARECARGLGRTGEPEDEGRRERMLAIQLGEGNVDWKGCPAPGRPTHAAF